ncbi:MAG: hypothetical protein V4437_00260 [Patescibacteria group bacterium]
MEDTSEQFVPAFLHSQSNKTFTIAAIGVVLVVLGAIYAYTVPVRLIGLSVFEGDYTHGKVFTFGIFGFHEKAVPVDGILADYASAGGTSVALVRNFTTNAEDITLVSEKGRLLTNDGGGKAALSVSEDGTFMAFAARTDTSVGVGFTPQLSAWTIKVVNIKNGNITVMGTGFAPQFFTSGGKLMLIFTGPTGITIVDLATNTAQTTFFLNPGVIDYAAHISRDGKFMAIPNGLTKHYDLFSVTHIAAPLGLSALGSVSPTLVHGGFLGDTFYGVERTPAATLNLVQFAPAKPSELEGEAVFSFSGSSLYRIIP